MKSDALKRATNNAYARITSLVGLTELEKNSDIPQILQADDCFSQALCRLCSVRFFSGEVNERGLADISGMVAKANSPRYEPILFPLT